MPQLGIPIDVEKSEIGSSLNSFILLTFLMGVYTVIYFGTIYVYLTKNSSKSRLVPAAITVLYINSIAGTAFQWYATNLEFVDNGATRALVFISLYDGPQWLFIAFGASSYSVFVIADGLLLWRCFFVWNRSFRVILVPLLLLITEAGIFSAEVVFHILYSNMTLPSLATAETFNNLLSAAFFISFATTLITTILIAYRVYSATKSGGVSRRRFIHVIDIVVQSGAVYALTLFLTAISGISAGDDILNTQATAFDNYTQAINYPLTGIITTIMVARVALLSAETTFPSTVVNLCGLQFHARSTQQTGTADGTDSIHTFDDDESISVSRAEKGEAKA